MPTLIEKASELQYRKTSVSAIARATRIDSRLRIGLKSSTKSVSQNSYEKVS